MKESKQAEVVGGARARTRARARFNEVRMYSGELIQARGTPRSAMGDLVGNSSPVAAAIGVTN